MDDDRAVLTVGKLDSPPSCAKHVLPTSCVKTEFRIGVSDTNDAAIRVHDDRMMIRL